MSLLQPLFNDRRQKEPGFDEPNTQLRNRMELREPRPGDPTTRNQHHGTITEEL